MPEVSSTGVRVSYKDRVQFPGTQGAGVAEWATGVSPCLNFTCHGWGLHFHGRQSWALNWVLGDLSSQLWNNVHCVTLLLPDVKKRTHSRAEPCINAFCKDSFRFLLIRRFLQRWKWSIILFPVSQQPLITHSRWAYEMQLVTKNWTLCFLYLIEITQIANDYPTWLVLKVPVEFWRPFCPWQRLEYVEDSKIFSEKRNRRIPFWKINARNTLLLVLGEYFMHRFQAFSYWLKIASSAYCTF